MLGLVLMTSVPNGNGSHSSWRILLPRTSALSVAWARSRSRCSRMTTNSSPPRRATVSLWRTHSDRRSAI